MKVLHRCSGLLYKKTLIALQLSAYARFPAMVNINREGPKLEQPLAIIADDGDNKLFASYGFLSLSTQWSVE